MRTAAAISSAPRPAAAANGYGTVFELAAGSGTITTLASFNGTNGAYPWRPGRRTAAAISSAPRNLAARQRPGTVFEIAAGSGTITTLASFNGTNGANPAAAWSMDSSGNLFGTTADGGASERGHGVRGGRRQRHHHHPGLLQRHQRGHPVGGLVVDGSGNLFGTTSTAARFDYGTVFEVRPAAAASPTLASFNSYQRGRSPSAACRGQQRQSLRHHVRRRAHVGPGTVFDVPAGAVTTVTDAGGTYDGTTAFAATVMVGAGTITGSPSLDYSDNTTATDLGSTPRSTPATTRSPPPTPATPTTPAAPARPPSTSSRRPPRRPRWARAVHATTAPPTAAARAGDRGRRPSTGPASLTYSGDQIDAGTYGIGI